jgi:peptide-methionine (S)-S-oxide reductase
MQNNHDSARDRVRQAIIVVCVAAALMPLGCRPEQNSRAAPPRSVPMPQINEEPVGETTAAATFGAGCFWCVEAVFQRLEGVVSVESGYAGGSVDNPTYEQVCSGRTGHAEVCHVRYDPQQVTYEDLLEVFFKTHDPTTLNRQGNDVGTQYRSVIFYHDKEQKRLAIECKKALDEAGIWPNPIVTEIVTAAKFYPAEKYHQNYFNLNGRQPYCRLIIQPKIEKLKKVFADKLKPNAEGTP